MTVTMAMTKTVTTILTTIVTSTMTMIVTLRTIRSGGVRRVRCCCVVGWGEWLPQAGGLQFISVSSLPARLLNRVNVHPHSACRALAAGCLEHVLDMHRGTRSPSCARFCRTRLAHGLGGDSEAQMGCTASGCTCSALRQGKATTGLLTSDERWIFAKGKSTGRSGRSLSCLASRHGAVVVRSRILALNGWTFMPLVVSKDVVARWAAGRGQPQRND